MEAALDALRGTNDAARKAAEAFFDSAFDQNMPAVRALLLCPGALPPP